MEISSKNLAALKYASNDESLLTPSFENLIKFVFDSFLIDLKIGKLAPKLDTKNLDNIDIPKVELKEITAALYTVIAEMARHNLDSILVSNFLEDIGFSNEKISIFAQYYQMGVPSLKDIFLKLIKGKARNNSPIFSKFNYVVSSYSGRKLAIRLYNQEALKVDNFLKENNLERINEPVYLIELKIEKPGETNLSKIQFSCTVEQLQDLVFKLKEASKSVERLAQI